MTKANAPIWIWSNHGTIRPRTKANTKSEARGRFKKMFNLKRLPTHTVIIKEK